MRYFILLLITLSSTAFIYKPEIFNNNPLRRVCLTNAGEFWSYEFYDFNDKVGFCQFNGGASEIDSLSLIKYLYEDVNTLAVQAFLRTKRVRFLSCESFGAETYVGEDSLGELKEFCVFTNQSFERSYLEKQTLLNGWEHPNNSILRALLR